MPRDTPDDRTPPRSLTVDESTHHATAHSPPETGTFGEHSRCDDPDDSTSPSRRPAEEPTRQATTPRPRGTHAPASGQSAPCGSTDGFLPNRSIADDPTRRGTTPRPPISGTSTSGEYAPGGAPDDRISPARGTGVEPMCRAAAPLALYVPAGCRGSEHLSRRGAGAVFTSCGSPEISGVAPRRMFPDPAGGTAAGAGRPAVPERSWADVPRERGMAGLVRASGVGGCAVTAGRPPARGRPSR